jgi:hypothetical protein
MHSGACWRVPRALAFGSGWLLSARCIGTFTNYLGHLRGACHALGFEAPPAGHQAVRRAMSGIAKGQLYEARPKMFPKKYGICNMLPRSRLLAAAYGLRDRCRQHGACCAARPGGANVCDAVVSLVRVFAAAAL